MVRKLSRQDDKNDYLKEALASFFVIVFTNVLFRMAMIDIDNTIEFACFRRNSHDLIINSFIEARSH